MNDNTNRVSIFWIVFTLVFIGQGTLPCQKARGDITWGYPIGFDQSAYLLRTYMMHEKFKAGGLVKRMQDWFPAEAPTGALLTLQEAGGLFFLNSLVSERLYQCKDSPFRMIIKKIFK